MVIMLADNEREDVQCPNKHVNENGTSQNIHDRRGYQPYVVTNVISAFGHSLKPGYLADRGKLGLCTYRTLTRLFKQLTNGVLKCEGRKTNGKDKRKKKHRRNTRRYSTC